MGHDNFKTVFPLHTSPVSPHLAQASALRDIWRPAVQCSQAFRVLEKTIDVLGKQDAQEDVGDQKPSARTADGALLKLTAIPALKLHKVLKYLLYAVGSTQLELPGSERFRVDGLSTQPIQATRQLCQAIRELVRYGVESVASDIFSPVVERLLNELTIAWCQVGSKSDASRTDLEQFEALVEERLIPYANAVLSAFQSLNTTAESGLQATHSGAAWPRRALQSLGRWHALQLLDIMTAQQHSNEKDSFVPQSFSSHLQVLQQFMSDGQSRSDVAALLQREISQRLLRPSASTVSILHAYILMIHRLRRIENCGPVLHAASETFKASISRRGDLSRVILNSLLNDRQSTSTSGDVDACSSLSRMMDEYTHSTSYEEYYEGIDLADLKWHPEPAEAIHGYRVTVHRDALGHILNLKENKELVDELQAVLGERLLDKNSRNFEKETHLLALFKARIDDANMQTSEVMVHDVMESTRTDDAVAAFSAHLEQTQTIKMQAQIVSKHYWPSLRDDQFVLPPKIAAAAQNYENLFRRIKPRRKLDWLPMLGKVVLSLTFKDRKVQVECTTWQATVIQQFEEDESGRTRSKSKAQLTQDTKLTDDLLQNALTFWVAQSILRQIADDKYRLIEQQSPNDGAATAAAAAAAAAAVHAADAGTSAALKSSTAILSENAHLYTNYITGMLTNQGGMDANRILQLLKMFIPGGVAFDVDELKTLLEQLVGDGMLEVTGLVYKIKRREP